MEKKFRKALVLTLSNLALEGSLTKSPPFSSGGCEWIVEVSPKGNNNVDNYLSLFLSLNETKSFGLIWKVKARYYFVLLNQSREETYRTSESSDRLFSADSYSWGWIKAFPLEKVLEKGVLVDDRFTIEVYIEVLEFIDGRQKENVDVNGFQVLSSQATSVRQIFVDHPDIVLGFKSKNQVVKTKYMNILLSLIEIVKKPIKSTTETELSNAHSELCELTEVGFKVEWLKTKLEEVALECKKVNVEGIQIQQPEQEVKNLELTVSSLKVELDKEKAKSCSLEKTLSDLKTELANEKDKSTSAGAKVLSLEKTLSDLKTELANEKTKAAIANTKFSDLKVELDKEKTKSTNVAAKALSLKEIWSSLKVRKDHKKENSAITDNLLSWEDDDLVSPSNCLGNGYKRIN